MYTPAKRHKCLAGALVVLWLMFIWGNSLLDGTDSSAVSGFAGRLLSVILGPWVEEAAFLLRKLGHFMEFAILGALLSFNGRMWNLGRLPSILGGLVAALVDETIQSFVPGRAAMVTDIWIDFGGVLFGVCVFYILFVRRK